MTSRTPPVPAENLSPKGPGDSSVQPENAAKPGVSGNQDLQGRQGDIHQNTTHQGHQQDR